MCVDAFGADHVHGVLLPGPYSSGHSCDDALELAQNLGVATETVSICEPFQAFENVLAFACGGELSGLAAENTQARCRMVCLMALSNTYGWMLVNTGNKSEACMGYSTPVSYTHLDVYKRQLMLHPQAGLQFHGAFMFLNMEGERFMNEATWVQGKSMNVMHQTDDIAWSIFDADFGEQNVKTLEFSGGGGMFWDIMGGNVGDPFVAQDLSLIHI